MTVFNNAKKALAALALITMGYSADMTLKPTGTIKGTVSVQGGANGDVPVYVNGTSLVGFTRANGDFEINGVPLGTHGISANISGVAAGSSTGLTLERVGDVADAGTIQLEKPNAPEKDLFASAEEKYARGDYGGARADFRQITGSSAYGEIAQYRIGMSFYLEDRFDDALTELTSVSGNGTFAAKALYFTARCKEAKGDMAGAEAGYRSVLERFAGTDAALEAGGQIAEIDFDRGYDAYLISDYGAAVEGLEAFLRNYPNSEDRDKAHYYLGKTKESQLNAAGAIDAFNSIGNSSSRYLDAQVEIARIKADFKRYAPSEALSVINGIIAHDRTSEQAAWAAEEKGDIQWDSGDTTGAIATWEMVLRDYAAGVEDSLGLIFSLGYRHYLKGDYNGAITWLSKHCDRASETRKAASSWYYRGRSHEKMIVDKLNPADPQVAKAREAYNKIIADYPHAEKRDEAEVRLTKLP